MISEQCEIILSCLLFQIRQHFRINPPFKQNFSVLRINYLTTIIRENKTTIISKFKGFGQRHQAISRSAGCQHNTYSHLLNLQQGSQCTLTNFFRIIEECSVYIKNQ